MRIRLVSALAFVLACSIAGAAQGAAPPPPGQNSMGAGPGGGQRGGRGFGGMGMGMGRGVTGTVTEVAADHYTVKTYEGETYTIHFSANTRILQQPAGMGRGMGRGAGNGMGNGMGRGGNPPQAIKADDIKVGDAVAAMGEVDQAGKSVGAMMVMRLDPERARQMEQMQANYGKTWLMGRVTAIDGVKVTLHGMMDNADHAFVADENTTFRERRNPITLADIHAGDMVRADGALKGDVFTATQVIVMPGQQRNSPPQ